MLTRLSRPRGLLLIGVLTTLTLLTACESTAVYINEDGTVDCATLYARRCSQCHALYEPGEYSDEAWVQKVRRYGPRAGVHPKYRPQLVSWLQAHN